MLRLGIVISYVLKAASLGHAPDYWVDATGAVGADGGTEISFKTLDEALIAARRSPHASIHLSPGTYNGNFQIPRGATLFGCDSCIIKNSKGTLLLAAGN